MHVLKCGDATINCVIYAHTGSRAADSSGAAGGVAPHNAAVRPSVKVVVEGVSTAVYDTLRKDPTALTKGNRVLDAAWQYRPAGHGW